MRSILCWWVGGAYSENNYLSYGYTRTSPSATSRLKSQCVTYFNEFVNCVPLIRMQLELVSLSSRQSKFIADARSRTCWKSSSRCKVASEATVGWLRIIQVELVNVFPLLRQNELKQGSRTSCRQVPFLHGQKRTNHRHSLGSNCRGPGTVWKRCHQTL